MVQRMPDDRVRSLVSRHLRAAASSFTVASSLHWSPEWIWCGSPADPELISDCCCVDCDWTCDSAIPNSSSTTLWGKTVGKRRSVSASVLPLLQQLGVCDGVGDAVECACADRWRRWWRTLSIIFPTIATSLYSGSDTSARRRKKW